MLPQAPALALSLVSHAGLRHLLLNMLFLALVGGPLELAIGGRHLIAVFFAGGAAVLLALSVQRAAAAWAARVLLLDRRGSAGRPIRPQGSLAGVKGAEPGLYALMAAGLLHQAVSNGAQVAAYGGGVLLRLLPAEQLQMWLGLWGLFSGGRGGGGRRVMHLRWRPVAGSVWQF